MNKYFIPNQFRSSFTIYRQYVVDMFNHITQQRNQRITDESKKTPLITNDTISNRTELIEFVRNFNKNQNK
jgi:3'-phosphoadenosine 5'-phosphosulfate sulfotransferase (PAPS reductase)/FAD synthetase